MSDKKEITIYLTIIIFAILFFIGVKISIDISHRELASNYQENYNKLKEAVNQINLTDEEQNRINEELNTIQNGILSKDISIDTYDRIQDLYSELDNIQYNKVLNNSRVDQ